jgi:4-hydroxybenzoate polyprenyltransferase
MPYPLPVGRISVAVAGLIAVIRGVAGLEVWLGWGTTALVLVPVALLVGAELLMHRKARSRVAEGSTSSNQT